MEGVPGVIWNMEDKADVFWFSFPLLMLTSYVSVKNLLIIFPFYKLRQAPTEFKRPCGESPAQLHKESSSHHVVDNRENMNREIVTQIGGGRNHGSINGPGQLSRLWALVAAACLSRFPFHLLPQLLCALSLSRGHLWCHFCFCVLKVRPFMLEYLEGRVPMTVIYFEMHQTKTR